MTDTKRAEIQRYEAHAIRMMNGVHYASLRRHDSGKSVLYSDHLRHLKLAQIAVLENVYSEDHPDEVCENIEYKIAALRKELEG